jgi:hypothetical protein
MSGTELFWSSFDSNDDDEPDIFLSDDELYYKSVEKLSDNRSTDTEENIKKQLRSRNYSTSTDDEDVIVVKVQIVETDIFGDDAIFSLSLSDFTCDHVFCLSFNGFIGLTVKLPIFFFC